MKFLRHSSVFFCVALTALALQMAFGFGHVHQAPDNLKQDLHEAYQWLGHDEDASGCQDVGGCEHARQRHHGSHDQSRGHSPYHDHKGNTPKKHDGGHDEHECPTCWTLTTLAGLAPSANALAYVSIVFARLTPNFQNDRRVESLAGRNFHARAPPVADSHVI